MCMHTVQDLADTCMAFVKYTRNNIIIVKTNRPTDRPTDYNNPLLCMRASVNDSSNYLQLLCKFQCNCINLPSATDIGKKDLQGLCMIS